MGGGCCVGNCCVAVILKAIGEGIKSLFCGSDCCVGYSSSSESSSSSSSSSGSKTYIGGSSGSTKTQAHAVDVANELAQMKDKMSVKAEEYEKRYLNQVNEYIDITMKLIEDLNNQDFEGVALRLNLDAIKQKNDTLRQQAIGCISNVMNRRLVQSDKELSTILEERNKKKRKENFESFTNKLLDKAANKFKKTLEKTVNEQIEIITSEINARREEVNKRLNGTIKELNE